MNNRTALPVVALIFIFIQLISFHGVVSAVDEINPTAAKYYQALKKRPTAKSLFTRFYNSWLDTGSLDGLREYLNQQTASGSAADFLILGFFYVQQGDDDQALVTFTKALDVDPKISAAWIEKAKLEARTINFDLAVKDLDLALEQKVSAEQAFTILKLKGRYLIRSGDSDSALDIWRQALNY